MSKQLTIILSLCLIEITSGIIAISQPSVTSRKQLCVAYLNSKSASGSKWECALIMSSRQLKQHQQNSTKSTKPRASFSSSSANAKMNCLCTTTYECVDTEEFLLETDLVDKDEYMKREFSLGVSFYTEECTSSLASLTGKDDWNCSLQYDRVDQDEFYCKCRRTSLCKRTRILKFK